MKNRFLGMVRIWTLLVAIVLSLGLLPLRGIHFSAGVLGAAIWAVLSFWAVEHLVRQALLPRGAPRKGARVALLAAAKIGLYGFGFWVLKNGLAPPLSCFFGFTVLLVVLVTAALVIQPKLVPQPNLRSPADAERGNDD